jgi:hypothetical protein
LENKNKNKKALIAAASGSVPFPAKSPRRQLLLFLRRKMSENYDRSGGGRDRAESITGLRDGRT